MKLPYVLWLFAATAVFISAATSSRAYIGTTNLLYLLLSMTLYIVGNLMMLLQYGNMSKELTKYNTGLFAEKVMPKLQPLFSEWEHKWWPKPMQKEQRAAPSAFAPGLQAAE